MLLDEVESLAGKKTSERDAAVLAILNAGYKKGQTVFRCVGASYKLREFHVYGPKAFACIGTLPGALKDRCIVIPMQRRAPGDRVARFRSGRTKREAAPVLESMTRTVKAFGGEIEAAYLDLPELHFLADRDEELFAPMFSVCAVLAPGRLKELESCARALCEAKAGDAVDDSFPMRLLADIRAAWPGDADAMSTEALIQALSAIPESPWTAEAKLTPRSLARRLRGFDVRPRTVRTQDRRGKGYVREELNRAFERYLPLEQPKTGPEA